MTEAPAGFLMDVPARLGRRGAALWVAVTGGVDMRGKPAEVEILLEACRCADRLEKLDELLSGDVETWARVELPRDDGDALLLVVSSALGEARQQQNLLKQLLAALRLPDEVGNVPQRRGTPRGAHQPKGAGSGRATVTALDRARARGA
ncbi:hypothetical protein [Kineosporia succinea]|uniref:Uncharacterized protein n=1 Tax=Kineosporia succinea TaxID=84632 RepID=A0ABT9P9U2_9ACTN|nr:hypothetical protein [Kineosporia succinea]MDP9829464.1 hypothetical protein [Kineosporia succinea]